MLIGLALMAGSFRLSYWQWERHDGKLSYIADMQKRLAMPIVGIEELLASEPPVSELPYRRVRLKGTFDFEREMVLRNRRLQDTAGVHLLTPMKLEGSGKYILVDRGFAPLEKSDRQSRKSYQINADAEFIGLLKAKSARRFMAPADPAAGEGREWVDAWLRVDLDSMSRQLPYPLLEVYTEVMSETDGKAVEAKILTSTSQRDDMFFLPTKLEPSAASPEASYPVPVFDTVIPPGRHFGYIFEWAFIGIASMMICLLLQLRRPGQIETKQSGARSPG